MGKVILIVLDGLRYDVAQAAMGYLTHLLETAQVAFYKVRAELPSLSRPCYETLLTGTASSRSGITANDVVRLSNQVSLFHLAQRQGLCTAAAAYHWFSELYNRAPFDLFTDREQHDTARPIQHGKFYFEDAYPDSHLFADAEVLRQDWNPDLLLVHPMGIDHAGHGFGSDSKQYRGRATSTDSLLGRFVPHWRAAGYQILITADHGMNADGQHGGTTAEVREVPLYALSEDFEPGTYAKPLSQLAIAPLVCSLLSLPPSEAMGAVAIPGYQRSPLAGVHQPLEVGEVRRG